MSGQTVYWFSAVLGVSQEEVSGPVWSSRTLPTCSSSCMTASAAHGCSCSSTSLRFDSLGWRRMRHFTGTSGPRIATCWMAATSTESARDGPQDEDPTQNCEQNQFLWPTMITEPNQLIDEWHLSLILAADWLFYSPCDRKHLVVSKPLILKHQFISAAVFNSLWHPSARWWKHTHTHTHCREKLSEIFRRISETVFFMILVNCPFNQL